MRTVYQFNQNLDQDTMNDIRQCLDNILRMPEGSIPLARKFGTSWKSVSEITPDAENDYAVEIVGKIEKYEPRVAVDEVVFEHDPSTGEMIVKIILEGRDDDEQ